MDAALAVGVLGKLRIWQQGRPVQDSLPVKAQALLCYLAVTGQPHSRHALAGLLWGEAPEEKAKNSLRVVLSGLRKQFPQHLKSSHLTVALAADDDLWLDTTTLARRLAAADPADADQLRESLALYEGDFLADFYVDGAPAFEEWQLAQRAHWQQQALRALASLANLELAQRHFGRARQTLRRWLAIEPWQEEAHRQLMLALARSGDLTGALAQYVTCRQLLEEELGVEPLPETTTLYRRISAARDGRADNLPAASTRFVGRRDELQRIGEMLAAPEMRLVSITGLGGMGKTRLALAAARQANRAEALQFLNGVIFVPLAGVSTPTALPLAIATALEAPLSGRAEPAADVVRFLRQKEMLLVLDNMEHLLAGVALIGEIVAGCPQVKILATSREPLQLAAEWRLDLEGLACPAETDGGEALVFESEAGQLFEQAARQGSPGHSFGREDGQSLLRLCRLVSGMPLALQLAAAWLRVLSLAEIVAEVERGLDILASQLRDLPPRQRSMRAIFEHTWAMLDDEEQASLQKLSLFQGGFSREAAAQAVQATPFVLAALVDRGLLQRARASGRYDMHELTRQFAAEKLAQDEAAQATAQQAHSHYFAALLQRWEERLRDDHDGREDERLLLEADNIRACWRFALADRGPAVGVIERALAATAALYRRQNWLLEGIALWRQALAALRRAGEPSARIKYLIGRLQVYLGDLLVFSGELEQARQELLAGQRLVEADGDDELTSLALARLAYCAAQRARLDEAQRLATDALRLSRAQGEWAGEVRALSALGLALGYGQHYDEAVAALQEALRLCRRHDLRYSITGTVLNNLSLMGVRTGDYEAARIAASEAIELSQRSGSRYLLPPQYGNLTSAEIASGELDRAWAASLEGLRAAEEDENEFWQVVILTDLGIIRRLRGELDEAEQLQRTAIERKERQGKSLGQRQAIVYNYNELGLIAQQRGHWQTAREWHQRALAIVADIDQREGMARAHVHLGRVALALAQYEPASQHFETALRLSLATGSRPVTMMALQGWAGLQVALGRPEAATTVAAFVARQPATDAETRQAAVALVEKATAGLPPDVAAAAEARAEMSSLPDLLAELAILEQ